MFRSHLNTAEEVVEVNEMFGQKQVTHCDGDADKELFSLSLMTMHKVPADTSKTAIWGSGINII